MLERCVRVLSVICFLGTCAVLFLIVAALGGLGPVELAIVLLITLPVSLALFRALTTLVAHAHAEA